MQVGLEKEAKGREEAFFPSSLFLAPFLFIIRLEGSGAVHIYIERERERAELFLLFHRRKACMCTATPQMGINKTRRSRGTRAKKRVVGQLDT